MVISIGTRLRRQKVFTKDSPQRNHLMKDADCEGQRSKAKEKRKKGTSMPSNRLLPRTEAQPETNQPASQPAEAKVGERRGGEAE